MQGMKGTKDKMEVDGTKFSIWLLYSHPRRTRGRLRLKRQSVSIWLLPKGQKSGHTGPRLFCASTTPRHTSEEGWEKGGQMNSKEGQKYQGCHNHYCTFEM